jgi:hypothetical protein
MAALQHKMACQNGSNTAGFIRLLHVLIADDIMWSLLVKDDIPELASGEARASLGHSSSDLWTHVHEAFIDNSRALCPRLQLSIESSLIRRPTNNTISPGAPSPCKHQIAYINGTTAPISFSEGAFATTLSPAVTSSTRQLVLKNLWMTLLTTTLTCAA